MATSYVIPLSAEKVEAKSYRRERRSAIGLMTALTPLAVAVHGYHPYAEDGGLYMAGIKRLLDPAMFPHGTEFVVEHLRFSLFAPLMASVVRGSHLSLEMVLLLTHIASFWVTLFAAWLLAARCWTGREARAGAVALLAAWMTLPVAGTSLMLMDPYVTARSFSTPCSLLALVGVLEFMWPRDASLAGRWRGLALCAGALGVAAAMHPLMAAYGLGCVALLGCVASTSRSVRVWGTMGLFVTAIAVALALQMSAAPETEAYRHVAMTRDYWFLSQWHWYEWIGMFAPLAILAVVAFGRRREGDATRVALARMAFCAGLIAMVVAGMFARTGSATYLVARLQPLRVFQTVYALMILVVGAALAERVLQRRVERWVLAFALLGGVMVWVERQTFPDSAHMELPHGVRWSTPRNQWEQAFIWISRNTPKDSLFALDANYISAEDEDAQCFRAIAERSVLPDYSKDGGEASITPALTAAWVAGQTAQAGLSSETDERRVAELQPLGVTWVVLERDAATLFACDYANDAVKVCRLP